MKAYQADILDWIADRQNVCLFIPFGSGKTRITLEWLRRNNAFPAVIVARPDDVSTWKSEASEIGVDPNGLIFLTFGSIQVKFRERPGVVPSPAAVRRRTKAMERIFRIVATAKPKAMVVDQSECIKNPRANQTIGATFMADCIRSGNPDCLFAVLTGNPTPQADFAELFSQIRLVDGGKSLGKNYYDFLKKYAYVTQNAWGGTEWTFPQASKEAILDRIAHLTVWIDPKETVLKELPEIRSSRIRLAPTPEQIRIHEQIAENFSTPAGDLNSPMAVVQALRAFSGGVLDGEWKPNQKAEWIAKKAGEVFRRAVIFASFTMEIEGLSRFLGCPKLTGEMTPEERMEVRRMFSNPDGPKFVVVQVQLGKGINELSSADAAIFTTPPWSVNLRSEAVARVVRPSRTRPEVDSLKVIDLSLLPIDEEIYDSLAEKKTMNDWVNQKGWMKWMRR